MRCSDIVKAAGVAFYLLICSSPTYSDDCSGEERKELKDMVTETFCKNVASGMRVKLYALKSLRSNRVVGAEESIGILERSVYNDRLSLENVYSDPACQTKNVSSAMEDATQYLINHSPNW